MAAAWKKNNGGRARKLRDEEQAQKDRRQVDIVKTAIRQYNAENRRIRQYRNIYKKQHENKAAEKSGAVSYAPRLADVLPWEDYQNPEGGNHNGICCTE